MTSDKTIQKLRKKKGLSQLELGQLIDVSHQFISNIERGKCLLPPKHIKKVAKTLRIKPGDLLIQILKDKEKAVAAQFKIS